MIDKLNFYSRSDINLDITNRCTLECPKCIRQVFRNRKEKIPGSDMPMKHFDMLLKKFDRFVFCGQLSDPIFHPKFIEILQKLRDNNKKASIHTAASQKSVEWYKKAFKTFPGADWNFGIDGLPKDSHKYRINQDGEKLFDVMVMASKIINNVFWQYIVFKYNEENIDKAKQMALDNNIIFELNLSSRWEKPYDPFKPTRGDLVKSKMS